MRAIVWTKYGGPDGLELQEVEKPVPKEHEVLIRIHATTVTAGDCEMRSLKLPLFLGLPVRLYTGLRTPQRVTILGQELAGEIEAVGKEVRKFQVGDQVFGTTGFGMGAYAEYICLPAEREGGVLATKPANMSFEQAAAVPTAGLEALHFLRAGNLQAGETVLINGSGGSIGTFGIQLAKMFGAEVTAVDSTGKLDLLRSVGADHVIDYTREDFTQSGTTYDVIFDVVGKSSYSGSIRSLKQNGRYLLANPGLSQMLRRPWTSLASSLPGRQTGKKVVLGTAPQKTKNLIYLRDLIEAGKLETIVGRRYPLEEVPEAHRYVETGDKKGNLVITVA